MTRTELNNLYNAKRIHINESAMIALNLGMMTWSKNHPWAEPKQYNKALRRKTVDLCLACPTCYIII